MTEGAAPTAVYESILAGLCRIRDNGVDRLEGSARALLDEIDGSVWALVDHLEDGGEQ